MTLALTDAQRETLRLLGLDGAEPIYRVSIETGSIAELIIASTPVAGTRVDVGLPGLGNVVSWGATHDPANGVAGIGATLAESAANLAAALREERPAISPDVAVMAWAAGNVVWIRRDALDEPLIVSGTAVGPMGAVRENRPVAGPVYDFVSGSRPVGRGDGAGWLSTSVLAVDAAGAEKDRQTRRITRDARSVVLRWDRLTEEMLTRHPIIGRVVRIWRGLAEVSDLSAWIPSGVYIVAEGPLPAELGMPRGGDPEYQDEDRPPIELALEDRAQYLLARNSAENLFPYIPPSHPLEAVRRIYRAVEGTPNAAPSWVDETTLDPSTSQWADVSHHVVLRGDLRLDFERYSDPLIVPAGAGGLRRNGQIADMFPPFPVDANGNPIEPPDRDIVWRAHLEDQTAEELLDELVLLIPGQVMIDETGFARARRISYAEIQAGTASIRDWTHVFAPDGGLTDSQRDAVTRLVVELAGALETSSDAETWWRRTYEVEDDVAARLRAPPGAQRLAQDLRIEQKWLACLGILYAGVPQVGALGVDPQKAPLVASSTGLIIQASLGFAGSRADPRTLPTDLTGRTPPPWALPSVERRVYLRLVSPEQHWAVDADPVGPQSLRPARVEVIECDGGNFAPGVSAGLASSAGFRDGNPAEIVNNRFAYSIRARGFDGTSQVPTWLPGCPVEDVTVARFLSRDMLDPFGWGFPVFEGRTPLDQLDVQIGDFVAVPLPHLIDFRGIGSAALSLVWEVVGKREELDHVAWTLALAGRGEPYVFAPVASPPYQVVPPRLGLEGSFVDGSASGSAISTGTASPSLTGSTLTDGAAAGSATSSGTATGERFLDVVQLAEVSADNTASAGGGPPTLGALPAPSGSDRMLVVWIAQRASGGTPGTVLSVSWGGQSLVLQAIGEDGEALVEIWTLDEAGIAAASGSSFSIIGESVTSWGIVARFYANVSAVSQPDGGQATSPQDAATSALEEDGSRLLLGLVDAGAETPSATDGTADGGRPVRSSAALSLLRDRVLDGAARAEASFVGSAERAYASLLLRSAGEGRLFRRAEWTHLWDATRAPLGGTLPDLVGNVDLPLFDGGFSAGGATGALAADGIGLLRLDKAAVPQTAAPGAYWRASGLLSSALAGQGLLVRYVGRFRDIGAAWTFVQLGSVTGSPGQAQVQMQYQTGRRWYAAYASDSGGPVAVAAVDTVSVADDQMCFVEVWIRSDGASGTRLDLYVNGRLARAATGAGVTFRGLPALPGLHFLQVRASAVALAVRPQAAYSLAEHQAAYALSGL